MQLAQVLQVLFFNAIPRSDEVAVAGLEPTLEFTTNLMEGRIRFNDACLWFGLLLSIAVSLAIHWHLKESDPALEYFVSELFTTTKMYECVTLAIMVTSIIPLQMINSKVTLRDASFLFYTCNAFR